MKNKDLFTSRFLLPLHASSTEAVVQEVLDYQDSLDKTVMQGRKVSLHDILLKNRTTTAFYLCVPLGFLCGCEETTIVQIKVSELVLHGEKRQLL